MNTNEHTEHNKIGRDQIMLNMSFQLDENSPDPVYIQIKNTLREEIITGKLNSGKKLPAVRKLASAAGVSVGTMERAVHELVSEGFCFRRPKKGTFIGDGVELPVEKIAARPVMGIYYGNRITAFQTDLVQQKIWNGIHRKAQAAGIDVFFVNEDNIKYYADNPEFNFKGVALLHLIDLPEATKLATHYRNMRFVYLNYYYPEFNQTPPNIHGVFTDEFAGGYQAADTLISHGHRDIAVFRLRLKDENHTMRFEGYCQALEDNAVPVRDELFFSIKTQPQMDLDYLRRGGRELMQQLLESDVNATALFCVNDNIAAGAAAHLLEIGRREDFEIIGFDNILPLSREYNFATIINPFEEMGEKAVIWLTSEQPTLPKIIRLTPKLLPRKSI